MAEALRLLAALSVALVLPLGIHLVTPAWPLLIETAAGLLLVLAAHMAYVGADRLILGLGALAASTGPLALGLGSEPWLVLPLALLLAVPGALVLAGLGLFEGLWRVAALSLVLGEAALRLMPPALLEPGRPPLLRDLAPLLLAVLAAGAFVGWTRRTALVRVLALDRGDPRLGAVLGVPRVRGRVIVLFLAGLVAGGAGGAFALAALAGEGAAEPAWGVLSLVAATAALLGGRSLGAACLSLVPLLVLPRLLTGLGPDLPDLSLPVAALGLALALVVTPLENRAPEASS